VTLASVTVCVFDKKSSLRFSFDFLVSIGAIEVFSKQH